MPTATTDVEIPDFNTLPGHELVRDPHRMLPSEAMRVFAMAGAAQTDDADPTAYADLLVYVEEHCVVDLNAYQKFYAEHGLNAVMKLVTAWLGELAGGAD